MNNYEKEVARRRKLLAKNGGWLEFDVAERRRAEYIFLDGLAREMGGFILDSVEM